MEVRSLLVASIACNADSCADLRDVMPPLLVFMIMVYCVYYVDVVKL